MKNSITKTTSNGTISKSAPKPSTNGESSDRPASVGKPVKQSYKQLLRMGKSTNVEDMRLIKKEEAPKPIPVAQLVAKEAKSIADKQSKLSNETTYRNPIKQKEAPAIHKPLSLYSSLSYEVSAPASSYSRPKLDNKPMSLYPEIRERLSVSSGMPLKSPRIPARKFISKPSNKKIPKDLVQVNKVKRDLPQIEDLQDELRKKRGLPLKNYDRPMDANLAKSRVQEASSFRPAKLRDEGYPKDRELQRKSNGTVRSPATKKLNIDEALQDEAYVKQNTSSIIQQLLGRNNRPARRNYSDSDSSDMEVDFNTLRREEAKRYSYVTKVPALQKGKMRKSNAWRLNEKGSDTNRNCKRNIIIWSITAKLFRIHCY
jgi:SPT2 chromatin protein